MTPSFTPSLNRVTLAQLPGLPTGVAHTRADQWLSTWGVATLMRQRLSPAALSGLPSLPAGPDAAALKAAALYPPRLDELLRQDDLPARALTDDLGLILAALLATLTLAPADARAARPDWPDSHWARWQAVQRVGLGGGLMCGPLGTRLHRTAAEWLPPLGSTVQLLRPPDPLHLALRGAAHGLADGPAVLLDAGHTSVKRAVASIRDGQVAHLDPHPSRPAPHSQADVLEVLLRASAELLSGEVRQVGWSLAVYTDEHGQPRPAQHSLYGGLATLPLRETVQVRLAALLGRDVTVRTAHDGTAAALALAGQADAAIMLGTSLGSGLHLPELTTLRSDEEPALQPP